MKKPFMAVLIALLVTACVGVSIFAIGGAALVNKNGVTPSDSPAQASNASTVNSSQQSKQVDQLQALVSQYKDREQQYQQREGQLQQQLAEANAQIQEDRQTLQQVQMLLGALQQRGLIRFTNDGRIVITQ
jgi:peptidoglycan hydrolase CwlO-like protein